MQPRRRRLIIYFESIISLNESPGDSPLNQLLARLLSAAGCGWPAQYEGNSLAHLDLGEHDKAFLSVCVLAEVREEVWEEVWAEARPEEVWVM